MRRSDREMKDMDQIVKIVLSQTVCCAAFHDDPCPYLIPMNYGAAREDGKLVLYFHGAKEGRKLDLLKKNPHVSFTILGEWEVRVNPEDPGRTTTGFESVCGAGIAELVPESGRKMGLAAIMNQMGKGAGRTYGAPDFSDELAARTEVWKITVDSLTGKKHE